MEWHILLFFLLLMFQAIGIVSSDTTLCHKDQSFALLQIKRAFTIDESASLGCDSSVSLPYPKTNSWNSSSDCCKWDGVTCDKLTGQVVGLDLSCSQLRGTIDSNTTFFQLSHLQTLNLAYNDFSLSQIPHKFGHFASLMHLNLSSTGFTGRVPSEISHLSKLVSLDLSVNSEELKFDAFAFKQLLKNLTQLRELHLSSINIFSVMPRNLSSSLKILDLTGTGLYGTFPDAIFNLPKLETLKLGSNFDLQGHLPKTAWNSSTPLKELDLSSTSFSGELPDSVGYLKSLTLLDLSTCKFSGSIPESLGNLTQINNLFLSSNNLSGRVPLTLASLEQLIYLDLSDNNLTGEMPDIFGKFSKLTHLSLADNFFTGKFPISVTNLTQLESLELSNVSISGPIPPVVSGFPNLILLFLGDNQLSGEIPSWIFHLPSLKYLRMNSNNLSGHIEEFNYESLVFIDLSENRLQGPIPSSLSKLVNLTYLYLSSNNFSGDLDVGTFSNLKHLRFLFLSDNSLSLTAPNKEITLPESLEQLMCSSCDIMEFNFLREAKLLSQLDLSRNKIHQLPDWALSNWASSVYYLNLSFNSLTDINKLNHFQYLVYVDIRSNLLRGSLPTPSPTTKIFFASNNNLTGELPHSICNLTSLVVLDLSNNNLTGVIPKCLPSISRGLSVLDMHGNHFHGTIASGFGKRSRLRTLNLHANKLEGTVPRSLANCRELEVLDLGNNNLNGTFPKWLGSLPMLKVLSLRSNRLQGPINNTTQTKGLFPELRIIDLSHNDFKGTLPLGLFRNFKAMMQTYKTDLSLKYIGETFYQDSLTVMIKGQDVELVRVLSIFTTIDFSSNKFEGDIPSSIGSLTSLRGLNLSHNSLAGQIPRSLGSISTLESLDISSNRLRGQIPRELIGLTFLSVLNLSQNHLEGSIPRGNQFNTFQNDSYIGNDGLCGVPLSRRCRNTEMPEKPPPVESVDEEDDSEFMHGFGWRSVMMGYGVGIVPGLFIGPLIFFPNGRPKWVQNFFRKR